MRTEYITMKYFLISISAFYFFSFQTAAQVVINEGSNRNYSTIADEDNEYPDWIELYNAGTDTVDLFDYALTNNIATPTEWTFPHYNLLPGEYKVVFCSGKDRKPVSSFVNVLNTGTFNATAGWNTHTFTTPFYWDGLSNVIINTCSYSSTGYTVNSVFNQSYTGFNSCIDAYQDGSAASCGFTTGNVGTLRPNLKLNGHIIGTGTAQNCNTCYPAPYGNWYWGAKNQILILASELSAAGLTAGMITSLAFDVVTPDPCTYDYIDFNMKLVAYSSMTSNFDMVNPNNYFHTNFKISSAGQTIFLYSPTQVLLSHLIINVPGLDNSYGCFPDTSLNHNFFQIPTPAATNNASAVFSAYEVAPTFSVPSGFYSTPINVSIINTNGGTSVVYYTLDGSDPTMGSTLYTGSPVTIFYSTVLKARAFDVGKLPSSIPAATYFFGVNHVTPVLSVVTENTNLFGGSGIFDNWWTDWQKPAYAEYFDSSHNLIFSQHSAIQMDGGAGGSRSQPQHSFRLELNNDVMGDGTVTAPLIPNRPNRTKFSQIYLRNGSNEFLTLPYKDAAQTEMMCGTTHNYHSAWRPISVYVNGAYFGLYELREKFDPEYFKQMDGSDPDSTEILSMSYWYNLVLRALTGSVDSFWSSYNAFNNLNPSDTGYWNSADQYFDQQYYTDYIIGESWMGNVDWPQNNIKIYRSDSTNHRWRFCIVDQELSLAPNGWTDCYYDHISYMLGQSPGNPYINIWLQGIQNNRFRDYFINRFADVMNTEYSTARILPIENSMFNQTVVEMQNEYQRWGGSNIVQQMNDFYNNHLVFQSQLAARTTEVRNHIQNNFTLPNQVNLTLDVLPAGSGKIHISTIEPGTYPWQGIYFNGLPVKIEAIADSGFHFLHWGNNPLISDTLNIVWNDTLNTGTTNFTAYFAPNGLSAPTIGNNNSAFTLFPNPATTELFLSNHSAKIYSELNYEILDLSGRILLEGNLNSASSETSLNIRSLPAAVYLLRVRNGNETTEQFRFVKMDE